MSVQVQIQAARAMLAVIRSALARSPEYAGESTGIDTVLELLAPVEAFVAERLQQDDSRREADVRRKRVRKSRGNPPDVPLEIPRPSGGSPPGNPREVARSSAGNPPEAPPAPPREEGKGGSSGSDPEKTKTPPPLPPAQPAPVVRKSAGLPVVSFNSNDLESLFSDLRRERKLGGFKLQRSDYTRAQNAVDLAHKEDAGNPHGWCERGIRSYLDHATGMAREQRYPFWGWANDPAAWANYDPEAAESSDEDEIAVRIKKLRADLDNHKFLADCEQGEKRQAHERAAQRLEGEIAKLKLRRAS